MKFIVNADDFGLNHEVNMAIVEAFEAGYISNTTIMVNMPGFEEAVELAEKHGFFNCVGLHLNLFEGKPLTDPIKDTFFMEDGYDGQMTSRKIFHELPSTYKFILQNKVGRALAVEAEEQMKKYRNAGFSEMHMDSHGHSHTLWSVYQYISPIAKKYGFRTMRLSLNYGRKRSLPIMAYKKIFNTMVQKKFKTTDYFTSTDEFSYLCENQLSDIRKLDNRVYEVMIHPIYKNNILAHTSKPDFAELMMLLKERGEMFSYNDLYI